MKFYQNVIIIKNSLISSNIFPWNIFLLSFEAVLHTFHHPILDLISVGVCVVFVMKLHINCLLSVAYNFTSVLQYVLEMTCVQSFNRNNYLQESIRVRCYRPRCNKDEQWPSSIEAHCGQNDRHLWKHYLLLRSVKMNWLYSNVMTLHGGRPPMPALLSQITGRERLIRSHPSARFCFELSGNSN